LPHRIIRLFWSQLASFESSFEEAHFVGRRLSGCEWNLIMIDEMGELTRSASRLFDRKVSGFGFHRRNRLRNLWKGSKSVSSKGEALIDLSRPSNDAEIFERCSKTWFCERVKKNSPSWLDNDFFGPQPEFIPHLSLESNGASAGIPLKKPLFSQGREYSWRIANSLSLVIFHFVYHRQNSLNCATAFLCA
jgi:hypothetical protein